MPARYHMTQRRSSPSHSAGTRSRSELAGVEAGLQRRGDLTLRVDETALASWRAPCRSTPDVQHKAQRPVAHALARSAV